MNAMDLSEIVQELNIRAKNHPVGELQEFRKKVNGLQRVPTRFIFPSSLISNEWVFHRGGREELQYNIGFEEIEGSRELRYGVAFSFETSRAFPSIDPLVPQVKLFNDFIRDNFEEFEDLKMWHWENAQRIGDYSPSMIPSSLVTEGVFIFLGKHQPIEQIDFELILDTFDRLFPLYKFVISGDDIKLVSSEETDITFKPGRTVKKSSTTATHIQRELDIRLRHNEIQYALSQKLVDVYGKENVREELSLPTGSKVDVVLRCGEEFWFYEIKTFQSPRFCIRQALGQLLEYAFWSNALRVTKLIVVGESPLDNKGIEYLETLRTQFNLPIEYEQVVVNVPEVH